MPVIVLTFVHLGKPRRARSRTSITSVYGNALSGSLLEPLCGGSTVYLHERAPKLVYRALAVVTCIVGIV